MGRTNLVSAMARLALGSGGGSGLGGHCDLVCAKLGCFKMESRKQEAFLQVETIEVD